MRFTVHAQRRMRQRQIRCREIKEVVRYGQRQRTGETFVYSIEREEVRRFANLADLRSLEGLHVVCTSSGVVVTTYRRSSGRRRLCS